MNIFVINSDDKVAFIVDEGLTPSLAKKVCTRLNKVWSRTQGEAATRLSMIVGYVVSDRKELSYRQALKLFNEHC